MVKHKSNELIIGLLLIAVAVLTTTLSLNIVLLKTANTPGAVVTGFAASNNQTGVVNFTQAGAAGVTLVDDSVEFGAGFYNSSCGSTAGIAYSTLNSQDPFNAGLGSPVNAPKCWVNTTEFPRRVGNFVVATEVHDPHSLENNGTTLLNLSMISDKNAADFVCGIGATCSSDNASVYVVATNNESGSCNTGLQSSFELLSDDSAGVTGNRTIGLCDSFNFQEDKNLLNVYFNISVPFDIPAGLKTMTVTYTGISL